MKQVREKPDMCIQVVRKGPFEELTLYSGRNGVSEGVGQTWETGGSGCWAEGERMSWSHCLHGANSHTGATTACRP